MKKRNRIRKVTTGSNLNQSNQQQPIVEVPKQTFTHDQLLQALYWVHDLMDRALVPFFLVKDTAQSMIENSQLKGDALHVGVRHNAWHTGNLRIVEAFALAEEKTKEYFKYDYNGVPIYIHIYKDHPCITSLNTRMYEREFFSLPNPYSEFLEIYS